jgi:hypothetical protein
VAPRNLGPRARSALNDLRAALDEYGTASSGSANATAGGEYETNQSAGRRPGESTDDYLSRVMFGGDRQEREAGYRQRAGRAATAARYGEGTGDYTSPWEFPDSSRVQAYQWDEGSQQLRVRFIKYSTPWVYNDIDLSTFQAFDAASSKGKFINMVLNSYPYRRATDDEEAQYFQGV